MYIKIKVNSRSSDGMIRNEPLIAKKCPETRPKNALESWIEYMKQQQGVNALRSPAVYAKADIMSIWSRNAWKAEALDELRELHLYLSEFIRELKRKQRYPSSKLVKHLNILLFALPSITQYDMDTQFLFTEYKKLFELIRKCKLALMRLQSVCDSSKTDQVDVDVEEFLRSDWYKLRDDIGFLRILLEVKTPDMEETNHQDKTS
jgi:hypothetical protein